MKTNLLTRVICMVALFALLSVLPLAADEVKVTVVVENVVVSKGQVYLAVYNSEITYKKNEPMKVFETSSTPTSVTFVFDISEGDYVFSVYQDLNANGKLDTNFIGIPKEPVALSNYSGSGMPGGFNKLKMRISAANNTAIVSLRKI